MNKLILEFIPIIILFASGVLLRKFNVLKKEDGDTLLKIIFYLALPALILSSMPDVELTTKMIFLPLIAVWIILIIFFVSFFIGKRFSLEKNSFGVFLVGSMIMEISFTLPFILSRYGQEGIARAVMFDIGNTIMAFSFVYFIACRYGENNNSKILMRKIIFSPPLLAAIFAIILNLTKFQLPVGFNNSIVAAGSLAIPLIMFSLGIYFNPKMFKILPTMSTIIIRMFIGLLSGFILAKMFGLDGLDRIIVLIGAAAPVCYNTLTFSSLEKLDKEFAANLISFSILLGFILIPILVFLLE